MAPSLTAVVAIPTLVLIVLLLIVWLTHQRLGWVALGTIGVWAIGGGIVLWIGDNWLRGSPASAQPRTNWIEGLNGWLLLAYFGVVTLGTVASVLFGPFGAARGVDSSREPRWIYVAFVPAAVAMLLLQAITSLHEYDFSG